MCEMESWEWKDGQVLDNVSRDEEVKGMNEEI